MKESIKSAFFKPEDFPKEVMRCGQWKQKSTPEIYADLANSKLEQEGELIDDDGEIKLDISHADPYGDDVYKHVWYDALWNQLDVYSPTSHQALLRMSEYQSELIYLGVL